MVKITLEGESPGDEELVSFLERHPVKDQVFREAIIKPQCISGRFSGITKVEDCICRRFQRLPSSYIRP